MATDDYPDRGEVDGPDRVDAPVSTMERFLAVLCEAVSPLDSVRCAYDATKDQR